MVERPQSARELVGQGHGGLVVSLAPGKLQCPALQRIQGSAGTSSHRCRAQDGASAMDEQGPQVGVPPLGDAAQAPLVRLAITNGVNYLFPPLLALAVFTLCLTMAAQAILLAVQQTQPRTSQLDAARLYRID